MIRSQLEEYSYQCLHAVHLSNWQFDYKFRTLTVFGLHFYFSAMRFDNIIHCLNHACLRALAKGSGGEAGIERIIGFHRTRSKHQSFKGQTFTSKIDQSSR